MKINLYAPENPENPENPGDIGYEFRGRGEPVSGEVGSRGELLKKLLIETEQGEWVQLSHEPGKNQAELPNADFILKMMTYLLRGLGRIAIGR